MIWACITPERERKTKFIMNALQAGLLDEVRVCVGEPPDDEHPIVVWGQEWLTLSLLPRAVKAYRPFFHVDNGYILPAGGRTRGYYRITYKGLSPVLLDNPPTDRLPPVGMRHWRNSGSHVLIALPGPTFGRSIGMCTENWCRQIQADVRVRTDRRIVVRPKPVDPLERVSLHKDLVDCWAVVTHSSNVAVDAAIAGVPVFVAPTNPAAPVGNLSLDNIENPAMPDRVRWLNSLRAQQFTLDEMTSGAAWRMLAAVTQKVDGRVLRELQL